MSDHTFICPHCGKSVEITAALQHELAERLESDLKIQTAKLRADFAAKLSTVQAKEKQLELAAEQQRSELKRQLDAQREIVRKELHAELAQKQEQQLRQLTEALKEKDEQLRKADQIEVALRKKQRDIEERERRQEVEVQRKFDAMRATLIEQTRKQEEELASLRIREKDQQLEQLKKTITELRQQADQSSMQVQGDAAEADIKSQLQAAFPFDLIEDVATGTLGADIRQTVRSGEKTIGVILWESKQTKVFSDQWLSKLKRDQSAAKAELSVLVTAALPKEITTFTERSGVWICAKSYAIPLATVLRSQLVALAKMQLSTVDRSTKTQQLYHYISSSEFRNRVEQLVVTFVDMQRDLDRESRALAVAIKRRQKQLESLLFGMAGMYGDLQGIIGGALPRIEQLELADGEEVTPVASPERVIEDDSAPPEKILDQPAGLFE